MDELIEAGSDQDIQFEHPQIEDVGKAFVEWAEQFWGIKEAYDKHSDTNSESASWHMVKPYFILKINELARNKKPDSYPPGYYKFNVKSE